METKRDLKPWLANKALEVAKNELKAEGKYQSEQIDDLARFKVEQEPTSYLVVAIIEYLEQLR